MFAAEPQLPVAIWGREARRTKLKASIASPKRAYRIGCRIIATLRRSVFREPTNGGVAGAAYLEQQVGGGGIERLYTTSQPEKHVHRQPASKPMKRAKTIALNGLEVNCILFGFQSEQPKSAEVVRSR